MKKPFIVLALLSAVLFTPFIIPNNDGPSVQARVEDPDCDTCQSNRRPATVPCLRFGGEYDGEITGWFDFGDRTKCKRSQNDSCSGETACTPIAN